MISVRDVVPGPLRYTIREQSRQLFDRGIRVWARRNAALTDAWMRERRNRHQYTVLSEAAVRAARKSDTVFIFGSGYSLNELRPDEWDHFTRHDVFGFNNFVYEKWIPIGFHLLRGGVEGMDLVWRAYAEDFTGILNANPHCANTIFLMQGEYLAEFCNRLIGYRYLKPGARIFRFHTNRDDGPPTLSFSQGLRHLCGTLSDAVNAAVLLGWTHIVFVGVDLYDSRYFWLGPDETLGADQDGRLVPAPINVRGHRPDETHNTARNGIVRLMGRWREWLGARGITLSVYNSRSLLTEAMPVYRRNNS